MVVCIVLFNPGKYLKYVINNIKILLKNRVEILIICNDGNKMNAEYLKKIFVNNKGIHYFINRTEGSPGEAFNQALYYSINANSQYCYFIDQDSEINKFTIPLLEEYASKIKNFSFLASQVIADTDGITLTYFRGSYNKSMTFHSIPIKRYNTISPINVAGYTGILINMNVIKKNKIFIDEKFEIELDDYDFTYRLSQVLPGFLVPESKLTHPNKKDSRNTFVGEIVDAYSFLFKLNRVNRDLKHVRNYKLLILKYGNGLGAKFKLFISRIQLINYILFKIKVIYNRWF